MDGRRGENSGSGGFTLVELIVAIALTSIVVVAVLLLFSNVSGVFNRENVRMQNQDDARTAVNQMAEYIRGATSSADNETTQSNSVAIAQPQEIVFYCDVDGDGAAEKVRYYLAGTTLLSQIAEPVYHSTSTPYWDYPAYTGQGIVVADAVRNGIEPIFTYSQYSGGALAAFTPSTDTLRRLVVSVSINLRVNERPDLTGSDVVLATDVQIRQRYSGSL
jgi:prepilin-type N-terminal cleavage/methylation domain-containing protein